MKQENSRLWLKLDKVKKELCRIKLHYIGTQDRPKIEEMITYVDHLLKRLEKDE
jgi:hypothetical protein